MNGDPVSDQFPKDIGDLHVEVLRLRQENERLREALWFVASELEGAAGRIGFIERIDKLDAAAREGADTPYVSLTYVETGRMLDDLDSARHAVRNALNQSTERAKP